MTVNKSLLVELAGSLSLRIMKQIDRGLSLDLGLKSFT
jgi:hypothetical protein